MHVCFRQASRAGRYTLLVLGLLAAAVFAQGSLLTTPAGAAAKTGVVSLTFDDSNLDQYTQAFPILQQYGMHGTFYVISGFVGVKSGFMTLPEIQALYNAGNEIAGHTVLHPDMTQLSTGEATREACESRDTLLGWGFPVTDFAYPLGTSNSAVEKIVQQCGFNSARGDFSLQTPYGCQGCALAESIPPADPYYVRAATSVQDYWTLSDMESLVTQAENTGGWMPIIFHHICANDCDQYSVSPALFSSFLAWLQTQPVSVKTVNQVMGGSVQPAVSAPQVPPAPVGTNGVVNASLENDDPYNPGTPTCWQAATGGTNSASFAETATAHSGSVGETVTMSNFSSGDAKLLIKQDLGQCAPSVVAGDEYLTSAWYQSTVPTRFVLYYRDVNGGWHPWTQSPQFAASGSWAQATWATPAVPSGATAVSFGMNIAANGTLTTDDYSLVDTGPPSTPAVSLTGPASGGTLSGPVTFTANASSPIGISKVDFLVNGVVVATATSAPWTANWDSTTVGDGPVTVTARATDIAGTQATTPGQADTVSNAASRGGNMLANASVERYSGGGSVPDCWGQGGSGTNTFTWSKTSNAHTGHWAQKVTISAYSSGDRLLVTAQNAGACSPRVTAGSTYTLSGWYQSTATVNIVTYYENSSGSWVYWTTSKNFAASAGWAQAGYVTPAVPSGAVALSFGVALASAGSLTTDDYSMVAGAPAAPSVSLTGPASGATLSGPVTFTAKASSAVGVAKVDFLVNGVVVATATSAPWTANWHSTTVGDGPVTVTARATDVTGQQATTSGQAGTVSNAASRGGNMLANASLERYSGGGSVPDCWGQGGSGTNTFTWSKTSNAHTGHWAQKVTISAYSSGDRLLVTAQNAGACSPRVTAGSTYTLSGWYQSTATVNIVTYYENSSGSWVYWTTSKNFAASSGWARAGYVTPAVPSGAVALSFGVALASAGSLTTDDYSMVAGAPAAPSVSLTGPASGATLSGPVTFTAKASSAVGVAKVDFLVNGVVVATATSAPWTANWHSTTVGDGPVTVTARATDVTGQQATTSGQAGTVSNAASRGGNMLANASLERYSGGGSVPDCWGQGGSGTNTFTWSKTSNAHTGHWAQKVTISAYSSGDRLLVTAQNAGACSPRVTPDRTYNLGGWYQSTQPTNIIAYYENASGTWVYWTQSKAFAASSTWAQATWTTPAVPSGAVALSFGLNLGAVGSLTTDDYTMTSH